MKSRIPKNARRVFKGVLHEVYQWRQKLFDGSSETFEMVARAPTTDVLAVRGGKIMVLIQEQPGRPPYPSFPGGRIDARETARGAATRELLEETGYVAETWRLVRTDFGSSKFLFPEYLFVASGLQKVADPALDSGERIRVVWKTFDQFLALVRNPRLAISWGFKHAMWEALLDSKQKRALQRKLVGAKARRKR